MAIAPVQDNTTSSLQAALRGLAARQRAHADNVANVETPGFKARTVDFEASLRTAMQAGNPELASVSTGRSEAPAGINGNNVDIDNEVIGLSDTGLRYQLVSEAVNAKFRLLRTAIGKGA
jgi:flagellar basal-body rod protein FlgB